MMTMMTTEMRTAGALLLPFTKRSEAEDAGIVVDLIPIPLALVKLLPLAYGALLFCIV